MVFSRLQFLGSTFVVSVLLLSNPASAQSRAFAELVTYMKRAPVSAASEAAKLADTTFVSKVNQAVAELYPAGDARVLEARGYVVKSLAADGFKIENLSADLIKARVDEFVSSGKSYDEFMAAKATQGQAALASSLANSRGRRAAPANPDQHAGSGGSSADEAADVGEDLVAPPVRSAGGADVATRDAAAAELKAATESMSAADRAHFDEIVRNAEWGPPALSGMAETVRGATDFIKNGHPTLGKFQDYVKSRISAVEAALAKPGLSDAQRKLLEDELTKLKSANTDPVAARQVAAMAILRADSGLADDKIHLMLSCFR
jgi:hypothetical protein